MSHQPPYAMYPRPPRAPQHAAALGGNAELRGRVRRAAKLIAITTVWIIGLAMVIAAVTMVAMATAPIARNSSTAVAQQAGVDGAALPGAARAGRQAGSVPAGRGGSPPAGAQPGPGRGRRGGEPRQASASAPARILAVYLGQGSANTSQFTIGGTGTWKLGWSFDCTGAGAGASGSFAVHRYGPGGDGRTYVRRRGPAGHGVSWVRGDAGMHYLAIRTRCGWRLAISSRP